MPKSSGLKLIFVFFTVFFSVFAHADDIASLSDAPPHFMGNELPESSYVKISTKRFKNAKAVWVNFDWLREHNIDYPKDGLTPEFEKKLLDALAYGIPGAGHDPSHFSDMEKTFYADLYGGDGIGKNFGSGRAASAGAIQIKGVGVTPLVGKGTSFDHAHGGASFEEAMREAIWGEVNHRELPYGSNRVIAIIDSGADTTWADGSKEKRALIIREDPLRPAQLMKAPFGMGELKSSDSARAKAAAKNAPQFFESMVPKEVQGTEMALEAGFQEYLKRIGSQYGSTYAARLYHGATSQSNIDARGNFLDFGTETKVRSFQRVQVLGHLEPFGDLGEIKNYLVSDILKTLKKSKALGRNRLPSEKEATTTFDKWYQVSKTEGMLKLTGAPKEIFRHFDLVPSSERLVKAMETFAANEFWSKKIIMDKTMPEEIQDTRLGSTLEKLSQVSPHRGFTVDGDPVFNTADYLKVIKETAPNLDSKIQSGFATAYAEFSYQVHSTAASEGISESALKVYMELGAHQANQQFSALERPQMIERDIKLITDYANTNDRSSIWNEINRASDDTKTVFPTKGSYQIVVNERTDHVTGERWQKVFDLKSNSYQDAYISADEANAMIQKMRRDQMPVEFPKLFGDSNRGVLRCSLLTKMKQIFGRILSP